MAGPRSHHRHAGSIGSMTSGSVDGAVPVIEMVATPDFCFPPRPMTADTPSSSPSLSQSAPRPTSMQLPPHRSGTTGIHRRAASTLPSFSFNPADATGLQETPPLTPVEGDAGAPVTPSKRGHKRGGSEFVGGDSRFGVTNALSSSPTKAEAKPIAIPNPVGPPAGRRGHAHRRSHAMSRGDLGDIMQPREPVHADEPRQSTSLPNTPFEHPAAAFAPPPFDRTWSFPEADTDRLPDADGADLARPPSRRLVNFNEQVEIIPRPLSTISSETESSRSTSPKHSAHHSISSVISLSNPGTPASRTPPRVSPSPTGEIVAPIPKTRSSLEISRKVEKEGQWLKRSPSPSPSPSLQRPVSMSAADMLNPPTPQESSAHPSPVISHKKRHSLFGDRRKSEPMIGALKVPEDQRHSGMSFNSASSTGSGSDFGDKGESKSSTKRIVSWAKSKLTGKGRDDRKAKGAESTSRVDLASPEMDLDAVFGLEAANAVEERPNTGHQPRIEVTPTSPSRANFQASDDHEYASSMIDLDAAVGPLKTPDTLSGPRRKQLHSSRLTRDFDGPGGHYNAHRRTNSSPVTMMTPFTFTASTSPVSQPMADVFEEDENEEQSSHATRPASPKSGTSDEAGTGISIVDSDSSAATPAFGWSGQDGLGIGQSWEPERPTTSWGSSSSRLSTPNMDRRASSIIEETIVEESSPVEAPPENGVQIISDHEDPQEPRASSLTKSSDSSDTPTLLAQAHLLPVPDSQQSSIQTPDTFDTSTFSSPDMARTQSSFDNSQVGTAASSIADSRVANNAQTADCVPPSARMSMDDVPSLTSSRSTMMSTMHANNSRRDFSANSTSSRAPSATSTAVDPAAAAAAEKRRKRASIQSLSQLMGVRSKGSESSLRPATSGDVANAGSDGRSGSISSINARGRKDNRLKKLMFWKSKSRQASGQQTDN
ncbi:hypothetical protein K431DRAFT_223152 [Polychaeton citri CBS 116435]|uniref:Cell wall proline rich protein n=1 Tax=Polychaeton citri CBS 116435 TaxID=1314669 RepID=A0A9P4QBW6_9PEZI|nr:hypothetical protein K431DRAFT_223152 [Polychaeton citri CBS 116435]